MVGKSSLTYRFINYDAPEDHDPTIEDKFMTVIDLDGKSVTVNILDTAGQDDYQGLIDTWIDYAEGFLLVFALNDRDSFTELEKKKQKIDLIKKKKKCPIVLVGNKSDLPNRQVTKKEAEEKAKAWGCSYFETFAKKDDCSGPFKECARQILSSVIVKTAVVKKEDEKCCCVIF